MGELAREYATDDFVTEWPQSGERLTKAATIRMAESYPEMSGTSPKFTYKRMLGGGDIVVIEGTIDYGDGVCQPIRGTRLEGGLRRADVGVAIDVTSRPFRRRP